MKDAKKARFHAGALGDHQHTNEKMGQTELRWQAIFDGKICSRKTQVATQRIVTGIYRRKGMPEETEELARLAQEEKRLLNVARTLKSDFQQRSRPGGGVLGHKPARAEHDGDRRSAQTPPLSHGGSGPPSGAVTPAEMATADAQANQAAQAAFSSRLTRKER